MTHFNLTLGGITEDPKIQRKRLIPNPNISLLLMVKQIVINVKIHLVIWDKNKKELNAKSLVVDK